MPAEVAQPDPSFDTALLQRAAGGDREAFEALVCRHQAALFRFARSIVANDADAEDVLQETFLAAYRNAGSYRGESTVRTWLLIIARNAAFRMGRKSKSATELDEAALWDLGMLAGWGQNDPETLAIRAQRTERLRAALDSLDPAAREILVLRELEGLSGEETAAVLGLNLRAMKSRLHRARLKLAVALRQEGSHART